MDIQKALKFISIADSVAALSKDRSTKVGAVALGPALEIRSVGYNGFPRGVNDDVEERHDRPAKYFFTAHAESNCVAQAARVGTALEGCTMIVTSLFPCTSCCKMIIQAGIKCVISKRDNRQDHSPKWEDEARLSMEMFAEAGVDVVML